MAMTPRLFKTRWFARFAKREGIADARLREAASRAESGLVDADLGGGVIKQRVARAGKGRSGGYRVVIAFRTAHRSVFLFGFAKNERENIDAGELASLKEIAAIWLKADAAKIEMAIAEGVLVEVKDES
jgi:hypothetical protein